MKNITKNRLDMYKTVLSVIKEHEPIWTNVQMMVQCVNKLETGISELDSKSVIQDSIILGVAKMRKEKFLSLCEELICVQDALWMFANATNNFELAARHKTSISVLKVMSGNVRMIKMVIVEQDLASYGSQLESFGVSAEKIASVLNSIESYRAIHNTYSEKRVNRKTRGAELETLSVKLNSILRNELDRLVKMFKSSYPSFVSEYFNARNVIHLKGKKNNKDSSLPGHDDSGGME